MEPRRNENPVIQGQWYTVQCSTCINKSFAISQSLLRLMSIESMMPSNCLILCHLLHLLSSIFPSIRVFSSESALRIRWPKYWSFSFSISPSNEYSVLISFRIDWFDLLAVQRTLTEYIYSECYFRFLPGSCDICNNWLQRRAVCGCRVCSSLPSFFSFFPLSFPAFFNE